MQVMEKRRKFEAEAFPHLDGLYRTSLLMLGNEIYAQELVQEAIVTAYLTRDTLHPMPNSRLWLYKIMASIITDDQLLSFPTTAAHDSESDADDYYTKPENHGPIEELRRLFFSRISAADVRHIITNLPDDLRLVIILSFLEGFSYREIADIARINLETVRSRLHLGRTLMQRELFDQVACEGKYDMPACGVRRRRTG